MKPATSIDYLLAVLLVALLAAPAAVAQNPGGGPGTPGDPGDPDPPTNSLPVVQDDESETVEDEAVVIDVLRNDSDPDGDALMIASVTSPGFGSAVIVEKRIRYVPTTGHVGADSFRYVASDGRGGEVEATVRIQVRAAPNAPPLASDDDVETDEDTSLVIEVLVNDQDDDGDDLRVTSLGTPSTGTATTDGTTVTFAPALDFFGAVAFAYTVSDGTSESTGTIRVNVLPVNDAPTPPTVVLPADGETIVLEGDLSETVSVEWQSGDVDGDALTYRWELATSDAFDPVLISVASDDPMIDVLLRDLDDAVVGLEGETLRVVHRVTASDGSLESVGPPLSLSLIRPMSTPLESDADLDLGLTLSPNPTSNRVALRLSQPTADVLEVAVYDALGRVVAAVHRGPAGHVLEIDLEVGAWAPGVYVVRAVGPNVMLTRTFTVAR